MHASIEQLLTLRDGDPVNAVVKQHISGCTQCTEELAELGAVRSALRGVSPLQAPAGSWSRLETHLNRPAAKSSWKMAAVAASLAVAVLAGLVLQNNDVITDSVTDPELLAAVKPPDTTVVEPAIGDLLLQSRRLEQLLRELDEPYVMNAGTAGTIAGIQEGIAVIDYGLSSTNGLSPGQSQQLWRQRVGLMNSLVQVRGAQLQQISN